MININVDLLQWFIIFFDKKRQVEQLKMKFFLTKNQQKNYNNPIIRKFEKRSLDSSFINKIWNTDLADMQLISEFNKGFRFLLLFLLLTFYSKYTLVIPSKDEKGISFKNILIESKRKPDKNMGKQRQLTLQQTNKVIFAE